MAASLVVSAGLVTLTDAATYFLPWCGGFDATNLTEGAASIKIKTPGTISKLSVYISANTCSVTSTVTVRKAGSDTALAVSFTSDQIGVQVDLSNAISISSSDISGGTNAVCIEVTIPSEAGTNTLTIRSITSVFTPDNAAETVSFLGSAASPFTLSVNSSDRRSPWGGPGGTFATGSGDANLKMFLRGSFTARNFQVNVTSNARTTDTVFSTRFVTANTTGALSVTYGSGATGILEDTGNSDALVSGDDYVLRNLTSTGGGNLVVASVFLELVSTNGQFVCVVADLDGTQRLFNETYYFGIGGSFDQAHTTTEDDAEVMSRFAFTASKLDINLTSYSIATNPSTLTLEVAGSPSALAASITTTGFASDLSNSVAVADGDTLALQIATPNTSGSLISRLVSFMGETAADGGGGGVGAALINGILVGGRLVQ